MATPVGHALAGILVGSGLAWNRNLLGPWRDVVVFAAVAQAPDLDFLPGLILGQPEAFHHGVSHSAGFALLAGLIMAWVFRKQGQAWRWGLISALVYFAQVGLDALTADSSSPYGVPLWWPISGEYVMASHPIFMDVRRQPLGWANLWHNLGAAGLEALILGPPTALMVWFRSRHLRRQAHAR
ncbi:MAG: metal-dependent hydrolase [Desulfarculaceae bacterium]